MRRILITAGPTREPIDPVRFISNASSGRQGVALAAEALARGYAVDLVHGPMDVTPPAGARAVRVTTAAEMLAACLRLHPGADLVVGAAAVSDYRPRTTAARKHKRTTGSWTLELVPNADILLALRPGKGSKIHAGFALETEDLLENAVRKLETKGLDWLVANSPEAIGAPGSNYLLVGADGTRRDLGHSTKAELARSLLTAMEATLEGRQGSDYRP